MKLSSFLIDIGKPVAYHPKLKKITGSTTATILLCQFIYWRGKEENKDGWLYKTSEEIEEETGLTYNEQKTARKKLIELGLMQEKYNRLDHNIRFLLDIDEIDHQWNVAMGIVETCDSGMMDCNDGESHNSTMANDEICDSLNRNTETTSQNTTKNTSPYQTNIGWKKITELYELPVDVYYSQLSAYQQDKLMPLLEIDAEKCVKIAVYYKNRDETFTRMIGGILNNFDTWRDRDTNTKTSRKARIEA